MNQGDDWNLTAVISFWPYSAITREGVSASGRTASVPTGQEVRYWDTNYQQLAGGQTTTDRAPTTPQARRHAPGAGLDQSGIVVSRPVLGHPHTRLIPRVQRRKAGAGVCRRQYLSLSSAINSRAVDILCCSGADSIMSSRISGHRWVRLVLQLCALLQKLASRQLSRCWDW